MDQDLETMTREQLVVEAKKLRAGIREHRDSTGRDLCWPRFGPCCPRKPIPCPPFPHGPNSSRVA